MRHDGCSGRCGLCQAVLALLEAAQHPRSMAEAVQVALVASPGPIPRPFDGNRHHGCVNFAPEAPSPVLYAWTRQNHPATMAALDHQQALVHAELIGSGARQKLQTVLDQMWIKVRKAKLAGKAPDLKEEN